MPTCLKGKNEKGRLMLISVNLFCFQHFKLLNNFIIISVDKRSKRLWQLFEMPFQNIVFLKKISNTACFSKNYKAVLNDIVKIQNYLLKDLHENCLEKYPLKFRTFF